MCVRVSATYESNNWHLSKRLSLWDNVQQGLQSRCTCAYVIHVYGPAFPLLSVLLVPKYGTCQQDESYFTAQVH